MYRNNLDGLAEQVRALEEQKHQLEVDLVGLRQMRWPQRALRVGMGVVVLLLAAFAGGVVGYRHAVVDLAEAAQTDARVAIQRMDVCNERLRELVRTKFEDHEASARARQDARDADDAREVADLEKRLSALTPLQ